MQKILTKLSAIMAEVDYIQKDKRNDFHKYTYASEKAIKETLHQQLVNQKIIFSVDVTDCVLKDVVTSKGNQEILTTLKLHYKFLDAESGECLEGDFMGSGQDSADKGMYKAITGAIKYILTSTFLIPTGDDPENEENGKMSEEPFPDKPLTDSQKYRKEVGATYKHECPNCGARHNGPYPKCFDCFKKDKEVKQAV